MIERYANLRKVSVEQVIRVECNEGGGHTEDDPMVRVVYWLAMDGTLIAHNDITERQLRLVP